MSYPPNRNGNMPVVREPPRHIHGGRRSSPRVRIIMPVESTKLVMWGCMPQIRGAFSICTEMCMNIPRTGFKRRIRPATR